MKAALIDDTGLYNQQLLCFNLESINSIIKIENGVEDAESYILRRLGIYEFPYMDGKFTLNLCANYYNYESGSEEPLLEDWNLRADVRKAIPNSFDKEGVISIGKL